ncbi:hypothetical protein AHiyo6_15920 [Arthrobacter sp. Hiyo6]|nr:hypothetical protein AHiyo6_15920 [Arthrobacter sp. Hiyo6]
MRGNIPPGDDVRTEGKSKFPGGDVHHQGEGQGRDQGLDGVPVRKLGQRQIRQQLWNEHQATGGMFIPNLEGDSAASYSL